MPALLLQQVQSQSCRKEKAIVEPLSSLSPVLLDLIPVILKTPCRAIAADLRLSISVFSERNPGILHLTFLLFRDGDVFFQLSNRAPLLQAVLKLFSDGLRFEGSS